MESRPARVMKVYQLPKGCRCTWASTHDNWGGDVKVGWLLTVVERSCPVHGEWLGSQDNAIDNDA